VCAAEDLFEVNVAAGLASGGWRTPPFPAAAAATGRHGRLRAPAGWGVHCARSCNPGDFPLSASCINIWLSCNRLGGMEAEVLQSCAWSCVAAGGGGGTAGAAVGCYGGL
jgi:hypothetical protein